MGYVKWEIICFYDNIVYVNLNNCYIFDSNNDLVCAHHSDSEIFAIQTINSTVSVLTIKDVTYLRLIHRNFYT